MKHARILAQGLLSNMDFPGEILTGVPVVEINGTSEAVVINHRGVIGYEPNRVSIASTLGAVTVNGEELQYGICWGYARASGDWFDVSPLTVALSCPYSEVRELVLKDPSYWLTNGFEFSFDLEKLNGSETAASDKEDVDNINSQHRREALAECWHGDNKLKYICDLPEFEGVLESIHNTPQGDDFESYGVVCSDPTEQQARDYIQKVKESGYNIDAQLIDELDKGGILEYTASNADGIICFISYCAYENERAYITIECSRIGDAPDWSR